MCGWCSRRILTSVFVRTFVNRRSNTRRLVGVVRTITLVWGKLGSLRYGSRSDLSDQAWQRTDFVWLLMWRPGCCQTVSMYGIGVTHHTTARRPRQTSKAHCMKTSSADGWIITHHHTGYNSKPWPSKEVIEKRAWAFGQMIVIVIYPNGSKYWVSSRCWGRDYQRFSVLGRKEGNDVFCTQACDADNQTSEYRSPIFTFMSYIVWVCIALVIKGC